MRGDGDVRQSWSDCALKWTVRLSSVVTYFQPIAYIAPAIAKGACRVITKKIFFGIDCYVLLAMSKWESTLGGIDL